MSRRQGRTIPHTPVIKIGSVTVDVEYWLTLEYRDIGDASVDLPSVIEWFNYQHQVHLEEKMQTEGELARAKAEAYFALKDGEFVRRGYGQKPTEASLDHAVELDDKVMRLRDRVATLTGWVDRFRNIQKSLQFKLELVRSNEATRRKILDN